MTCVWLSCLAIFALESTVGVSWAITLDIGAIPRDRFRR